MTRRSKKADFASETLKHIHTVQTSVVGAEDATAPPSRIFFGNIV